MGTIKQIARRVPFVHFLYRALVNGHARYRFRSKNTGDIFTEIYRTNAFGGIDSVSGPGSDNIQTRTITQELPKLFDALKVSTMLDIPCGDFYWMKNVDLNGIDYTGADIVEELVQENNEKYARERVRFQRLNLLEDSLPKVDLVFCRDCLVHLCFADILLALDKICRSESEYLLTTTYTRRKKNRDIVTGLWRVLNLQLSPFDLPTPQEVIVEFCTERGGAFDDKALGLWRIADIRESLILRST